MTSNSIVTFYEEPTRLEVYAQYERHMAERDALIAERLCCTPAYWAAVRETNPDFWELMERRAMMTPPRLRPSQVAAQRQERFAPGEYLRWSQRYPDPAYTRWDWLGWALIAGCACWFASDSIPDVHDFLISLLH